LKREANPMHNEFFLVVLRKQKNCDEGGLYEKYY